MSRKAGPIILKCSPFRPVGPISRNLWDLVCLHPKFAYMSRPINPKLASIHSFILTHETLVYATVRKCCLYYTSFLRCVLIEGKCRANRRGVSKIPANESSPDSRDTHTGHSASNRSEVGIRTLLST